MPKLDVNGLFAFLLGLSRYQKRFILALSDLVLLNVALWLAMSMRWGYLYLAPTLVVFCLLAAVPILAVAGFFQVGLYRHVTRHFDSAGDQLILLCISISSLGLGLGAFLLGAEGVPRTVLFLYPLLGTLFVSGSRRLIRMLITQAGVTLPPSAPPRAIRNVVIYGAWEGGLELLRAVRRSRDLEVVAFVDPDPTLRRQYLAGIRVYGPEQLAGIVRSQNVSQVILAMQHASRKDRLAVLALIEDLPVDVRILPQIEDIATGRVTVGDLRRVEAADLLGRPPIPPDPGLMLRTTKGRSVLVTGAGGSIGSELVRQILRCEPQRVVLLDASESALYDIEVEVAFLLKSGVSLRRPEIIPILGSALNERLVTDALRAHGVQTVYHAAAFKHVPMLEHNVIVGVRNNAIATEVVARAAEDCGVGTFVLVSTDKAVRPSSIMGTSKRVAELLVQARAARKGSSTTFAIVRFGNVLDSSGSVVPLFRKQIEKGGPVTVTHPDASRYFISIPEAAALVIQAGAIALGGEVFALDMGEPVNIVDLAKMMITLSGLQLRDVVNPEGDVEIVFTGLRPGEKLVEELHLAGRTALTVHPRIVRMNEPALDVDRLHELMDGLKAAIASNDVAEVKRAISAIVPEYHP